ncbi:pyruvate/ketoisovalerate oxidoreductase, gamma subunit [Thermosinus carboxydivorans Nor1]|uniref:Pyruvate/ketoisovalerate oxidoreductase, gamma subunit n=1 Tax=Thermosinus carboxydivorans Nor1 TaxID=401526 RepID=A1HP58_9FIRM|nr:2-oxoacid:acceptor oxidoreductase family protein [Thermosinus carboxydivorans]EAX48166.1 pyruvate/ketoisovalerate oxidoreductase, gamma subunit [Thermosinus carboxydivorans Nor1]
MAKVTKIALAGEGGQGVQSIAEILAEAANEEGKNALYIPNFGVEQRGGVSIAYVQISDGPIGAPKFQKADILIPLSPRAVRRTKLHAGRNTVYIYDNSLIQEGEVNDNIVGLQYMDVTPPNPAAGMPNSAEAPAAGQPNQDLPQDMIAGEPKTASFTVPGPGVDPADIPAQVKRVIPIPANDIAKNELHPRVFNMIILGAVIAATEVLPLETIKRALETKLGDKFKANPELRDMNFKALERGYEIIKGSM